MNLEKLTDFIENIPNARLCVESIAFDLRNMGFVEYSEKDVWEKPQNGVKGIFVVRGSSIIAVKLPKKFKFFNGVLTHSDSPCLKIKVNPELRSDGYIKLNVEPYGAAIYHSWLDKPLSICGSVPLESGTALIDTFDGYQVVIPSQAIHINRDVNDSNKLNPQTDLCPIFSLDCKDETRSFEDFVREMINTYDEPIYAMDLSLYNPEPVKIINLAGAKKDANQNLIMGPRLDNLASVFAAYDAFLEDKECDLNSEGEEAQVFVAFGSEEIGSSTYDGAAGQFLNSVLERICAIYAVDKYAAFASSVFLSVDAAHAIHPNAPEKSDPTNVVKMGKGIVIKHNDNYATEVHLEAAIKQLCKEEDISYQDFYSRSDMRCGATLGNISMNQHGIRTLDIGIPMLAMHSSVETICADDIISLIKLLKEFYNTGRED